METEKKQPKTMFRCTVCQFSSHFDYFGSQPPFAKAVVLLEDAYVMKDPFVSEREHAFMVIGGNCSLCNKAVCCNQKCSMFYSKRFCIHCSMKHLEEFPEQIKQELSKNDKSEQV